MNMALTARLFLSVSSITLRVMRPLNPATSVAANAPTADDSTMLVTPITNRPVIEKTISSGRRPARSRRIFSPR